MTGAVERSFRLSPSAPQVPDGAEEADDFPDGGVALIDLLGDEIALRLSNFPKAPGAKLPEIENQPDDEAAQQVRNLKSENLNLLFWQTDMVLKINLFRDVLRRNLNLRA